MCGGVGVMSVRRQQNATIVLLGWRYYGRTAGVTGAGFDANKGISAATELQAGQIVYLPEIQPPAQRETVQLWD